MGCIDCGFPMAPGENKGDGRCEYCREFVRGVENVKRRSFSEDDRRSRPRRQRRGDAKR